MPPEQTSVTSAVARSKFGTHQAELDRASLKHLLLHEFGHAILQCPRKKIFSLNQEDFMPTRPPPSKGMPHGQAPPD